MFFVFWGDSFAQAVIPFRLDASDSSLAIQSFDCVSLSVTIPSREEGHPSLSAHFFDAV